jgi:hypothetical protein
VLLGELRKVKSTNSTRRYLPEVLDALTCLPSKLVRTKLQTLAEDRSLTPWGQTRIQAAVDDLR